MKHLDLFSGIGGFALAARWVGWETVGFCEIDQYCQKVLRKHWPDVPIYEDVRELDGRTMGHVDIITGGFPCQDISYAGKGAGIRGERSGLWSELCRIIGELRPGLAVLENVSALLGRGLDVVLGDLAEIGYDAEWHCISAAHVGAPHLRDRIWIIAYPQHSDADCPGSYREAVNQHRGSEQAHQQVRFAGSLGEVLAHTLRMWQPQQEGREQDQWRRTSDSGENVADTDSAPSEGNERAERGASTRTVDGEYCRWEAEPDVGRVAHGIPKRVDRLKGLGNAIVPHVAEVIFRAIDLAYKRQEPK